jgi:hypothetical protein
MPILNLKRLDRIDWDFPKAGTKLGSIHTIHWFPGNYIEQIPAALIQVLSKPNDVVLDPFGGSGTTAIEALKLGRHAVVSDHNSACVHIADAKLSLLANPLPKEIYGKILSQLVFDHLCRSSQFGMNGEGSNQELTLWYESETLSQLRYIWSILEQQEPQIRKPLFAVFSNLLFTCASTNGSLTKSGKPRRHHWGWVADNVRPKKLLFHNAVKLFCEKLVTLVDKSNPDLTTQAKVIQQDARHMILDDESIDLVVTSPPYVGVIDYTHANRLLYLWMGWSIDKERIDEIGARYRRSRKNAVAEYLADLRLCRDEIHRVIKKESYCAIVIGESKKFPDAAKLVVDIFAELMPIVWGPKPRYYSRRRVSEGVASEPVELICVFQKI